MTDQSPPLLSDYLSVLKAHRLLIAGLAILCAGVALLMSAAQEKTYRAEAQLSFNDPTQSLAIAGAPVLSMRTPADLAKQSARLVTRTEVLERVRPQFGLGLADIAGKVSASADSANLVVVTAEDSSAKVTGRLANAVANAVEKVTTDRVREQYKRAATQLRQRRQQGGAEGERTAYVEEIGRLDSLSAFADPVDIVRLAQTPSAPVKPQPVLNGLIGLFLGLLLGVGAAFLRHSVDQRLRNTDEIRDCVNLPLLGYLGQSQLGFVAFGPDSALKPPDAERDHIGIVRTNLHFLAPDREVQVVLVTSPQAEEGKSTLADSLAFATARSGKRTLLVECDLRRPTLAQRVGCQGKPGIGDYLHGAASATEILQPVAVDGDPEVGEVVCIAAGEAKGDPASLLASPRFTQMIEQVREVYDVVIIDSPPLLPVPDSRLLVAHVDHVALCIRAEKTTRREARAAIQALGSLPQRPTGLVITDLGKDEIASQYAYAYYSEAAA